MPLDLSAATAAPFAAITAPSGPFLKSSYGWLSEDLVGCLGPDEGVFALVPAGDEGSDLGDEVTD